MSRAIWVFVLLLAALGGCGGDPRPPLEEACEALRPAWEKAIRAEIVAEMAARVPTKPLAKSTEVVKTARPTTPRSGPSLSKGERALIDRAASGHGKRNVNELVIEATPGPDRLTRRDQAALADDPAGRRLRASGGRGGGAAAPKTPTRSVRPGVSLSPGTETLKLMDLVIATGVESRQPVEPGNSFRTGAERYYCYAVYNSGAADQVSTHVWRLNGKVLSRVELTVGKSPSWRTWSRHRARPSGTGDWSCEILSPSGERLGIARFKVGR